MALRPSSVSLQVPLPSPLASSLPAVHDPVSDLARAAGPTVPRLLATVVIDPSFESTAASAPVAELVDFAVACRLDYATALVAESESDCPPSVGGECALGTDVLEDRKEDFECLAVAIPHLMAMRLAPEGDPDAPDIPTPRSYAEAITVPPSWAKIVDGMWIFRVKRPPGSPSVFKARYVARGFNQRQRVDFFHTFSPTPKMTTLRVLLHVAAQRDYELHSLDFSTAFLHGSLHEEIWRRRPPGFTGSFPAGTQWSLRRPVYSLRQTPHEWQDTLRTLLAALGFVPSTADPSLFLRTDTSLPSFYVLVYVVDLVFATADTKALALVKSELQKRHTCTDLGPSVLRLPVLLAIVHSSAYRSPALNSTFERVQHWEAAKRVLRYLCSNSGMGLVLGGRGPVSTRSSSVLSSSYEAEIYAGAMAAQELRWLTYLLTNLGEWPRSSPVLYVDNKAMIALCQEHRLEHIALRYFVSRELQQRGQLRLAYVATWANTADIFTMALQSARCAALYSPRAAICSPRAAFCSPRAALLLPALACPRAALLAAAPPLAVHAPPICGPLTAPCSSRVALWQPARRPLQPARRPLAARSPPICSPLTVPCSPCAALCTVRRPAVACPAACSPAGRRPPARAALLLPALLVAAPPCLAVRRPSLPSALP
ncbi:unnamed protein product [Closterium sp. NIES-53]